VLDVVCRARGQAAEARDGPIYLFTVKQMVQYKLKHHQVLQGYVSVHFALHCATLSPYYDLQISAVKLSSKQRVFP
jgi:hypothetical protein